MRYLFIILLGLILLVGCIQPDSPPTDPNTNSTPIPSPIQNTNLIPENDNIENEGVEENTAEPSASPLSYEERIWNQRIDAALAPVDCPPVQPKNYPSNYYKGKLIDAHMHIPAIPDFIPEEGQEGNAIESDSPLLGVNVSIENYLCTFAHDGIEKAFIFFPVYDPIRLPSLEIVKRTMEKYPTKFIPFIMPPDSDNSPNGSPTVDAATLKEMVEVFPNLFKGYGEIGLYARPGGATDLPPNSLRLQEVYPIVRENNLVVYFHLGIGHQDNFEAALQANPDIKFIFHGDQLVVYGENNRQDLSALEEILSNHSNAFYGIDELYGDDYLIRPEVSKEEFLAHFENYSPLLEEDLATWKGFIERHPNQVIWGTDRGVGSIWSMDREVGIQLTDYARAFIGRLSPEVQEKFAYKNVEKLFE